MGFDRGDNPVQARGASGADKFIRNRVRVPVRPGYWFCRYYFFLLPHTKKKGKQTSFAISLHVNIAHNLVNRHVVFISFSFTEKQKIIGLPRSGS